MFVDNFTQPLSHSIPLIALRLTTTTSGGFREGHGPRPRAFARKKGPRKFFRPQASQFLNSPLTTTHNHRKLEQLVARHFRGIAVPNT